MHESIDLYLQAAIEGQIDEVPLHIVLPMELHLMDCVAIKSAGGEHLVHWELSEELH